jgi:translation initiation factor 3 subunit I
MNLQRPIALKGHERAINQLKFNREGKRSHRLLPCAGSEQTLAGDLIFTCSKDHKPCVWFADNGERLGSYKGHNGVVWALDVSYYSEWLLTASGTAWLPAPCL